MTAADTVLKVISRSKKGVSTSKIMERTGFTQKKVANIVFKLKQQGRIKNVRRGIYVKS
jgi:predicted transcriptional regulator